MEGALPSHALICTLCTPCAPRPGLEAVITMLPSTAAATEAYLGSEGILSVGHGELRPHVLIDWWVCGGRR